MIGTVVELIRVRHWIKNFFVFFPLIFSVNFLVPEFVLQSLLATIAFSFASSFCYIINDIADRKKDASHPVKKNRPLASGKLGLPAALGIGFILLGGALALSFFTGPGVPVTILVYILISLGYSFFLKHIVIIDVFIIAFGFVLRVFAGALAIGVALSNWFLLTTLFLSLFMGFGKRRHDLLILDDKKKHRPVLEHYSLQLLDYFIVISVALIIITYSLYTVAEETVLRFRTNAFISTVPFVVYGVFRYLYLVYKKEGGGDPADIVLRDKSLIAAVVLWFLAIVTILTLSHFNIAVI